MLKIDYDKLRKAHRLAQKYSYRTLMAPTIGVVILMEHVCYEWRTYNIERFYDIDVLITHIKTLLHKPKDDITSIQGD